ncbi:MAG: 4Fe-4S binding protein [Candidatus Pacebacteria bacterium]|nr:4Fe-4S binding protein [Candidatus Paceibacterota bacterium]
MYKVDKDKCLGCGGCTITCPNGITIGADNKANIIDEEELQKAGGIEVCPYGALVMEEDEEDIILGEEEGEEDLSY